MLRSFAQKVLFVCLVRPPPPDYASRCFFFLGLLFLPGMAVQSSDAQRPSVLFAKQSLKAASCLLAFNNRASASVLDWDL
ncbi:uncharacterized protein BDV17DRAFT_264434 [Aspergillus undulatus]|uniref:uncharacterized protein n=1 Tax=Aspergillus undulatus TaxID=1810928 RepID=UPI003CCCEDCA